MGSILLTFAARRWDSSPWVSRIVHCLSTRLSMPTTEEDKQRRQASSSCPSSLSPGSSISDRPLKLPIGASSTHSPCARNAPEVEQRIGQAEPNPPLFTTTRIIIILVMVDIRNRSLKCTRRRNWVALRRQHRPNSLPGIRAVSTRVRST